MSGDLDRAAVALAAVAVTDRTAALRGEELAAAAAARDAVLTSARRLLAGVVPESDRWGAVLDPLAEIQRRPARVLHQLLTRQPLLRVDGVGLSDALAHPATTPAVRQWQTAARYLFLAEHAWSGVQIAGVPPDTAWGVAAVVAGTALALDRLDTQLADAYRADGHPDLADRLTPISPTGLRVAAREVLAAAGTGPVDTRWTPPPGDPGHVHPVRGAADLSAGAHRYRDLVAHAPTLSPTAVSELVQGQRIVLHHAARLLRPTQPDTAAAVDQHLRDLAAVPAFRRVATILPSDPRPAAQLRQLLQQIGRVRPDQLMTDPAVRDTVRAAAAAIAATAPALAAAATRQRSLGRWVVPAETFTTPQWRRIDTLDRLPTLDALTVSGPSARRAVTALTPPAASNAQAAGRSHAVDTLTAAAAHAGQPTRGTTPDHPTPPAGGAGRNWTDNAADLALRWHPRTGRPHANAGGPGGPGGPSPLPPPAPVRRPTR